jgi:hypothetical protein
LLRLRTNVKYNLKLFEKKVAALQCRRTTIGVIYTIYCNSTKRSYIGRTTVGGCRPNRPCEIERFRSHYNDLKNNKHCRTELQEDWNKFGEQYFEFEVIEIMEMHVRGDDWILSQQESWWIENLPDLYNKFH